MHWIDGFSLDDNLISGQAGGIGGGEGVGDGASGLCGGVGGPQKGSGTHHAGDSNHNAARSKRRRHAQFKLNTRLDRKSSRGMIYENEELRLRTININAEVERGQSDIKRLRRENEQLRREIWTLRDECDRLNKRFKANHGSCNARCSGGSSGGGAASHKRRSSGAGAGGGGGCHSASNTDDSDSCDTCRGDDQCSDDCCTDSACRQAAALQKQEQLAQEYAAQEAAGPCDAEPAPNNASASALLNTFDHLSVVSEETLSNSDLQVPLSDGSYLGSGGYNSDLNGSQMTIPSFGPLTPLTPIELVANQLNDLQAVVPPLSYFENIVHQNHMGSTIGTTPETAVGAPRISRHTNGWDYNLQSPFAHHAGSTSSNGNGSAYHNNSNSASGSSSTATNSTVIQPPMQTFSTFVPATSVTPPTAANTPDVVVSNASKLTALMHPCTSAGTSNQPTITFASPPSTTSSPSSSSSRIETVAITTMPQQRAAAATAAATAGYPVFSETGKLGRNSAYGDDPPPPLGSPKHFFSPLKPRLKLNTTLANKNLTGATAVMVMAPTVPPMPVRPPVAPQPLNCHPPDIYVTNALASPYHRQPVPTIRVGPPLVTKPSSSPPPPPTLTSPHRSSNGHNQANSMNSPAQTDSVNLEAILNDIETISEDILAIQLDKNKSRDHLPPASGVPPEAAGGKPLQPQDKTKKPYKSEMNLLLSYEGTNPTITPAQKVDESSGGAASATSTIQRRRTRSLEGGDHTDSPSSMPDPMAPFPDNHTYIGFEHLNSAASTQTTTSLPLPITVPYSSARPPLPPGATPSGNGVGGFVNPKPAIPPKPSPPSRAYPSPPPPLNIRCAGIARTPTAPTASLEKIAPGLSPNKSQLYSSLASAAAKRANFRSAPTNMTSSLDEEDAAAVGADGATTMEATAEASNATRPEETSPSSDAAKRKAARRVSILCNEFGGIVLAAPPDTTTTTTTTTDSSNTSKGDGNPMTAPSTNATTATTSASSTATTPANGPLTSGSYSDLTAVNPTLRYLRQMQSYSTPNSPHASRRPLEPSKLAAAPGTHNSLPPQSVGGASLMTASTLAINQQHHHQQQQRKASQDSTRGHSGELATAAALVARSRCSRRHSDGTVVGSATQQQRNSGAGGGNHHHSHHHSHQHTTHQHGASLLASHNPHHSHHSRQDSNHETATSLSDRNSNSLASSRESSTSFSMRSQRRKISVSSHTGGKIPWCGCWGNGCL